MAGKSKKKLIVVGIAIAVLVGVIVRGEIFRRTFRYAGTLEVTKVDLSSRLASNLATVPIQEGDSVKVGETLATLVCDDIQVAAELANINFTRNARLFTAGTVSRETMDLVRNRKEESDIRSSWCAVRSPIVGTVLSRYHEPGEWVSPGTKLLTLANTLDIWTYIYVPQPEVSKLKVGEKVKAYLPELNDREFVGTVLKINEEAEFTPKNVQTRAERTRLVYGVKISFLGSNEDRVLKPGMTVEVVLPGN